MSRLRPLVAHSLTLVALVVLAATAGACDEESSSSGSSPPVKVTADKARISRRVSLAPYRALLDEAARAELDAGGLLIELGTADQHKYTRGGWRSGWGAPREIDEGGETISVADMTSRRAWLDLPAPRGGPPRAIVVRARSAVPGQVLTLHAGGRALGVVPLAPAWTAVPVDLEAVHPPEGRFRLELRAGKSPAGRRALAEIDRIWLATTPAPELAAPRPRIGPVTVAGAVRRSILAPAPRTYSFYLEPPAGAHLIADLGAAGRATFTVTATADGAPPVELVREKVAGSWRERDVSLERFAGQAIRLDLATSEQDGEAAWGEPEIRLLADRPRPAAAGGKPPRNLVLIVIDTARADLFGPFAGPDRVARTPRFDQLAARSTAFTRAYVNENWTKPSVATILSGLYPSTHDTKRDPSVLPDGVELLSQRLTADGFATAGFVANGFISGKFGFERGWDLFRNYIRESRPSEAEHVYSDAIAWLEKRKTGGATDPFFLYLQTIDPHVPYKVDAAWWKPYFEGTYRGPLGPSIDANDQVALGQKKIAQDKQNVAWLRALYQGEVSYHDDQMGRFLDELDRLGLRDDTLLVVTNDHGEELGDRGRFGHGHQIYEELVRAPLMFSYPPLFPAGARVDDIVELVDVTPTILDALGRDPMYRAEGESLLPIVRGEPGRQPRYAIIEFLDGRRAVRVGSQKLLAWTDERAELYDLAADPGEHTDLAATHPIARRLCEVHLGEGLAVPDKAARQRGVRGKAGFRSGNAVIDPAVRRQLEALGYFGSTPGTAARKASDEETRR